MKRSGRTEVPDYAELRVSRFKVRRLMSDYANYHAGFGDLFRGERLIGILTDLMGEQAVLFKEKVSMDL
jgi:hypothetical protein